MKEMLFSIMMAIAAFCASGQKDTVRYSLDNNINGSFAKYSDRSFSAGAGFMGDNLVSYRKIKLSSSTNYSISFKDSITSSELLEKANLGIGGFFLSEIYSRSMARSIRNDNSIGVGFGKKLDAFGSSISLSYAAIYQITYYYSGSSKEAVRSSFRIKIKKETKSIGFSSEIYYQPSFSSMDDYIVYGSAKLVLFPKNKLSFLVQDAINYISTSDIKTLHNITFGIGFSMKN